MSVMSVGRKPKALVRPLGAGNSRADRGKSRAGDLGVTATRSDKRDVRGVSVAGQPGVTARPTRRAGRGQEAVCAPAPVGGAGRRRSRRRRAGRPPCRSWRRRRWPGPGWWCRGRGWQPTSKSRPGRAAPGRPGRPRGRVWSGRRRRRPGAGPASAADQAHPARTPGGLGFRGSPLGRGAHSGPARPGVRCPGRQSRPAAVRGAGQHAARRGQAGPVPVVDRVERGAPGRPAVGQPADHANSTRWAARLWCPGKAFGSPGAEPHDPVPAARPRPGVPELRPLPGPVRPDLVLLRGSSPEPGSAAVRRAPVSPLMAGL